MCYSHDKIRLRYFGHFSFLKNKISTSPPFRERFSWEVHFGKAGIFELFWGRNCPLKETWKLEAYFLKYHFKNILFCKDKKKRLGTFLKISCFYLLFFEKITYISEC